VRHKVAQTEDFDVPGNCQLSLLEIIRAVRERQQASVLFVFDQFERSFLEAKSQETRVGFIRELKQCLDSDV